MSLTRSDSSMDSDSSMLKPEVLTPYFQASKFNFEVCKLIHKFSKFSRYLFGLLCKIDRQKVYFAESHMYRSVPPLIRSMITQALEKNVESLTISVARCKNERILTFQAIIYCSLESVIEWLYTRMSIRASICYSHGQKNLATTQ